MTTYLEAVEATITAACTILNGRHTALLQLVRPLVGQMDVAYLSTLKDLGRVMAVSVPTQGGKGLDELR